MAINVTVRDIVNFPGGTAKTITCDIAQVVTVGGSPEGDELWITSATTTATASGGGSIQAIFKNILKRGWLRGSAITTSTVTIPSSYGIKIALDEGIASGISVTLTAGTSLLPEDIAEDLETLIRNQGKIGAGGAKAGDLSYLNCQVRFVNGRFQIESGTIGDSFTGSARSSVEIGAPATGTDARSLLGLVVTQDSQTLAGRQLVETTLGATYTSGSTLTVVSTAGLSTGNPFLVTDGTNTSFALVSGTGAGTVTFATASGLTGLSSTYASGSVVRRLHDVDTADPVSAVTSVDQLYRFAIDSIVNQIHFG